MAPHGTVADVFKTSLNEGNWPTQGLSYCVGFIGNVATFVGKSPAQGNNKVMLNGALLQMSEEIENAALNVPRAIFTTMVLNGATGYAMILAVLFCLGDVKSVVNTPTQYPFIQVFYNGTRSYAGATIMTALIIGLLWCAVIGFLATASRMTWSFARDRGLPFHRFISKVERRTSIPMIAIAVVTTIPCLLALIYIGSSTVFEDVVSLSVSGLYASYLIPCALLLWRRTTGQIRNRSSHNGDSEESFYTVPVTQDLPNGPPAGINDDDVIHPPLVWGPWRIPGMLGTINNAFACVYIVFVIFWSFWPPITPSTAENMNYSILVTGTVIGFSIVYYYVWGKEQYKGPLIEREVKKIAKQEM
ncbi:MAG: hypothetical protein M1837_004157 [Sclerophora amabilis]|nr:MAG: hypothetical protein M1837_004157 [Sclerophora amabilis]